MKYCLCRVMLTFNFRTLIALVGKIARLVVLVDCNRTRKKVQGNKSVDMEFLLFVFQSRSFAGRTTDAWSALLLIMPWSCESFLCGW